MCPDIPPFLTGLEHTPICILFPDWWWAQAPFCTGQNHKETGSVKRGSQEGSWPLLWCWPASTSQESTIHCLIRVLKKNFFFNFLKKFCLSCNWAEKLLCCFKSLLGQDKSREILPAWGVISRLFQLTDPPETLPHPFLSYQKKHILVTDLSD